jgi:hypothetical protein
MNPLDAVCDRPRTDAICVNQLKNAKVVDKGLLQERPDVKIFLPFKFLFYRPDELFQPHQYNKYLGKHKYSQNNLISAKRHHGAIYYNYETFIM